MENKENKDIYFPGLRGEQGHPFPWTDVIEDFDRRFEHAAVIDWCLMMESGL